MRTHRLLSFSIATVFLILGMSYAQAASDKTRITIDGSSTVFPITEAIAEEFLKVEPKIQVVVGSSGTGGGFKKFALGEIDINNASRTIKDSEAEAAKKGEVEFLAIPVAYDGITVVVNKKNDWAKTITVAELKKLWEPSSKVKLWSDIRADWPKRKILLYGPGTDSGTFDFFTEAINGKSQVSRSEFTKSEDDNVLVQGVEGDKDSLGYFGYAYYISNKERLNEVAVDNGKGSVMPTVETIASGAYTPLSRTVYIYVSKKSAKRPEVQKFVQFYLDKAASIVKEVGYIPLAADKYAVAKKDFEKATGLNVKKN
jgi:phosphate transport system substrate-binding protein